MGVPEGVGAHNPEAAGVLRHVERKRGLAKERKWWLEAHASLIWVGHLSTMGQWSIVHRPRGLQE